MKLLSTVDTLCLSRFLGGRYCNVHTIPSKETCRVYNHETFKFHVIASPVTVYNYNCRHISTLLRPQVPCFCKLKTNRLPAWGNNHLVVSQIKFNLTFRFPLFSCDDRIITFSFGRLLGFFRLSSYLWYSKKTFPGGHHLLHVWAWFRGTQSIPNMAVCYTSLTG